MTEKTTETVEDAAETIIELVEHTPAWALILAACIGGGVVFFMMLAISKAPATETAE